MSHPLPTGPKEAFEGTEQVLAGSNVCLLLCCIANILPRLFKCEEHKEETNAITDGTRSKAAIIVKPA